MIKLLLVFSCLFLNINAKDIKMLDNDHDMIENKYDKCPNTPDGVCVDDNGCTQHIKRVIEFNTNSFTINKKNKYKVNNIIEIAQECFGYDIEITGHTDSTYNATYNLSLSKTRALSLKELLILNSIDPKRITTKWYGEIYPISTNVTPKGRAKNRRVEILFK